MEKIKISKQMKKQKLPNAIFKVGYKKYKFIRGQFIVPGVNKNQPITAEEALKNAKVLTYLVKARSAVIVETNQLTPAEAAEKAKAEAEAEAEAAEEAATEKSDNPTQKKGGKK